MQFRPCIDIHNGKVKQIVGSSLRDAGDQAEENFVAEQNGTDLCLVSATPSSETTSANSGLLVMMPMAFDVSMLEPPPMASRKSAPDLANASRPSFTFLTVGFCFISLNTSYGICASSSTSSTFCATPNLIRSLSVQTSALCKPRRRTSPGNSLRAPGPK